MDLISVFDESYNLVINKEDIIISSSYFNYYKCYHVIINSKIDNKVILFETNRIWYKNSACSLCYNLIKRNSKLYKNILKWKIYNINYELSLPFSKKSLDDDTKLIPVNYKTDPINIAFHMVTSYSIHSCERYLIQAYGKY